MTTWEESKRVAQSTFLIQENSVQPMPDGIGAMYQQILSTGHITPSIGGESLTQQIAEELIEPPETQQLQISRSVEQEKDIEPER